MTTSYRLSPDRARELVWLWEHAAGEFGIHASAFDPEPGTGARARPGPAKGVRLALEVDGAAATATRIQRVLRLLLAAPQGCQHLTVLRVYYDTTARPTLDPWCGRFGDLGPLAEATLAVARQLQGMPVGTSTREATAALLKAGKSEAERTIRIQANRLLSAACRAYEAAHRACVRGEIAEYEAMLRGTVAA